MSPTAYQILYVEIRGRSPFERWFRSLPDRRTRAVIRRRIDRLSFGLFGDCRDVGGSVWELKIDLGPGFRVHYSIVGKHVVLLLTGGDKRTQRSDIKRAQELLHEWKSTSSGD